MKRAVSILLTVILLTASLTVFARASNQISSYSITLEAKGNGVIEVKANVAGTSFNMIEIGFSAIMLYEEDGNDWDLVKFKTGLYNPVSPSGSYSYSFTYEGTAGKEYYARVSYYARDSEGQTSRHENSHIVTAT